VPSRNPFLKRRPTVFRYRMRPTPSVRRRTAFLPQLTAHASEGACGGGGRGARRATSNSPRSAPPRPLSPPARPARTLAHLARHAVPAGRTTRLRRVVRALATTTAQNVRLVVPRTHGRRALRLRTHSPSTSHHRPRAHPLRARQSPARPLHAPRAPAQTSPRPPPQPAPSAPPPRTIFPEPCVRLRTPFRATDLWGILPVGPSYRSRV
jgi:hypothetical protein